MPRPGQPIEERLERAARDPQRRASGVDRQDLRQRVIEIGVVAVVAFRVPRLRPCRAAAAHDAPGTNTPSATTVLLPCRPCRSRASRRGSSARGFGRERSTEQIPRRPGVAGGHHHRPLGAVASGVVRPTSVDDEASVLADRRACRRQYAGDTRNASGKHFFLRLVREGAGGPRPSRCRWSRPTRLRDRRGRSRPGHGPASRSRPRHRQIFRRHHAEDAGLVERLEGGEWNPPFVLGGSRG